MCFLILYKVTLKFEKKIKSYLYALHHGEFDLKSLTNL